MKKLMDKKIFTTLPSKTFVYLDPTVTQSALCDMYLKQNVFKFLSKHNGVSVFTKKIKH